MSAIDDYTNLLIDLRRAREDDQAVPTERCTMFNLFVGDSADYFPIEFELARIKDLKSFFVPIVFLDGSKVSETVRAWAAFNNSPLLTLIDVAHFQSWLVEGNYPKLTAFSFAPIANQYHWIIEGLFFSGKTSWVTYDLSGNRKRESRDDGKSHVVY